MVLEEEGGVSLTKGSFFSFEQRYAMYRKNFQEPTMAEGFQEIKRIGFVPQFATRDEERIFLQFTSSD